MYRQGDVLVVPIAAEELPAEVITAPRDRSGRMILARGEATGHAHVVTGEGLTLLCLPDDIETMFLHVKVYGRIGHEEHGPIPLPAGYYRVVRQREYVPGDGSSNFGGADQASNYIGESPDIPLAAAAEAWLGRGLAAEPADRPAAEAAVRLAYQLVGLPDPERFSWHDSPRAGAIAAAQLTQAGETGRSVRPQVRTKVWADARARQTARLGAAGWAQHWAASGARTWQLLNERIVTPLRTRLAAELTSTGTAESELTDKELAAARLTLLDAVHGQHDGAWLAAFCGADQAGNVDDDDALAGLAGVARSAGWWWPYERVVILTERPLAVHRDNLGRLHHGDGPALSYPDGWGLHAWRGMPIPAAVAAQLPHLTVERIRDEANAEVRRVMLEHFGFDRYLQASGARELGRDEAGILWRVELERDEPLVMVEVVNSTPEPDGTSRTYFLRVPPNIRTARAGVAWTFGLTEEEYRPLTQT